MFFVAWFASIYVMRAMLWDLAALGSQDEATRQRLARRFRFFLIERRVGFALIVGCMLILGTLSQGFPQLCFLLLALLFLLALLLLEIKKPLFAATDRE
ncbi:hypothetical protein ACX3O0_01660 [Homoserinimonas sp. A447]